MTVVIVIWVFQSVVTFYWLVNSVDKTVLDLELDIAHSASGYGETIGQYFIFIWRTPQM